MPPWLITGAAQLLLFLLLAGMAASVDVVELRQRFRKCSGLFIGLGCQFGVLPLFGYLAVVAFRLPPVLGIALLAVTSSPGGAYSNWWCSVFNADLALSIAMTTCSTLVSVIMTPINLVLYVHIAYGQVPDLHWGRLIGSIVVAAIALCAGLSCSAFFPQRRRTWNFLGNLAGVSLLLFSAMVSSGDSPIWDRSPRFYAAVAFPCTFGLAVAFCVSRMAPCLSGPEGVAVTVETCYQNTGLALTIALASFDEVDMAEAAGVPLFYSCVQVVLLPMCLLFAWKCGLTHAPSDLPFHLMVLGEFQGQTERKVKPTAEGRGDEAVTGKPDAGSEGGPAGEEAGADGSSSFRSVLPDSEAGGKETAACPEGGPVPAEAVPAGSPLAGTEDRGGCTAIVIEK